jgi:prolyl-tRNA synthetase
MAAIIEQNNDGDGITWPRSVAPYDVHILSLGAAAAEIDAIASDVADLVAATGLSVLLDERDQRPGEKFADADILGCPLRVTVGKKTLADKTVDVRVRRTSDETRVEAATAPQTIRAIWETLS